MPTLHSSSLSLQHISHTYESSHPYLHWGHINTIVLLLLISPTSPYAGALLCSSSPPRARPTTARSSRSVCSGHSGQELKCSEEELGASAPRLQERTALTAAAAPPAPSHGASERRSRCSEPSRASVARPLPKFAWGPKRGLPGNGGRSAAGVTATASSESPEKGQRSSESGSSPGGVGGAPQSPAPVAAGAERRGKGQQGRAFLETRGTWESRGEKRHFPVASILEGARRRTAFRRTP
ncbi:hypothetical protein P7K49_011172 [Saguinus oedipus]|uniref:Uncharacterized protein n=1 Tax=Saguinus oedipus TaxID=9490 RepID=A0ABQ9VQK4_SAGOE|nr:hypothetical protein P7K49_011172 [Saguinus oedipus]